MSVPSFRERLWPGPLGWSFVPGFAGFAFIALLPVHQVAAAVASVVTALAGCAVAVVTSTAIEVRDGGLRVGRARIPLTDLGEGGAVDRSGVRRALGPGSDARAFACVRTWIPSAVALTVVDADDPTPMWLVSTRRPDALLEAVRTAKGQAQAAHSVQTS